MRLLRGEVGNVRIRVAADAKPPLDLLGEHERRGRLASLGRETCVPTVRIVRGLIFQWVSADGSLAIPTICVRIVRGQAIEILRLRTVRTVRTVISLLYLGEGNRAHPRVTLTNERDPDSNPAQRSCRAA